MADLFGDPQSDAQNTAPRPLADRLRPKSLGEVIGQEQVLGPDAPLGVIEPYRVYRRVLSSYSATMVSVMRLS